MELYVFWASGLIFLMSGLVSRVSGIGFGWLDLYFGCLGLYVWCLDLYFVRSDLYFRCMDLYFGCAAGGTDRRMGGRKDGRTGGRTDRRRTNGQTEGRNTRNQHESNMKYKRKSRKMKITWFPHLFHVSFCFTFLGPGTRAQAPKRRQAPGPGPPPLWAQAPVQGPKQWKNKLNERGNNGIVHVHKNCILSVFDLSIVVNYCSWFFEYTNIGICICIYPALISSSSKSPSAAKHTIGCAPRWEYVCRKSQNELWQERQVMANNASEQNCPGKTHDPPDNSGNMG